MAYEEKQRLILEAAVRRFAHFGLSKTTMAEIAQDLAFSKALLYYYYPDKYSLFAAGLQYEIEKTFSTVEKEVARLKDSRAAMFLLLDKRIEFVSQNYKLLEVSVGAAKKLPQVMREVFAHAQKQQEGLLELILQRGVEQGRLKPVADTRELAGILLYAIEGMRFSILQKTEEPFFPSPEEFQHILRLQKKMLGILLDGLSQ